MLDLEGVLVYLSRPSPRCGRMPRPYAQQFVDECSILFDEVYMNTCASEENALHALKEEFRITSFGIHEYQGGHRYQKARDYEKFENSRIIHVEDGISKVEYARIKELGHHYLPIKSWGLFLSEVEREKDNLLLGILDQISLIIGKQNA
jgi:hypothetical protein